MDYLDISVATQFFSPIVASYAAMSNELNSPYSSIKTHNDFLFVLRQVRIQIAMLLLLLRGQFHEAAQAQKVAKHNNIIPHPSNACDFTVYSATHIGVWVKSQMQ